MRSDYRGPISHRGYQRPACASATTTGSYNPVSKTQRRPDVHNSILPPRHIFVRDRAIAEVLAALLQVTKEPLHPPRRRKAHQQAAWAVAVIDKRMRHP